MLLLEEKIIQLEKLLRFNGCSIPNVSLSRSLVEPKIQDIEGVQRRVDEKRHRSLMAEVSPGKDIPDHLIPYETFMWTAGLGQLGAAMFWSYGWTPMEALENAEKRLRARISEVEQMKAKARRQNAKKKRA